VLTACLYELTCKNCAFPDDLDLLSRYEDLTHRIWILYALYTVYQTQTPPLGCAHVQIIVEQSRWPALDELQREIAQLVRLRDPYCIWQLMLAADMFVFAAEDPSVIIHSGSLPDSRDTQLHLLSYQSRLAAAAGERSLTHEQSEDRDEVAEIERWLQSRKQARQDNADELTAASTSGDLTRKGFKLSWSNLDTARPWYDLRDRHDRHVIEFLHHGGSYAFCSASPRPTLDYRRHPTDEIRFEVKMRDNDSSDSEFERERTIRRIGMNALMPRGEQGLNWVCMLLTPQALRDELERIQQRRKVIRHRERLQRLLPDDVSLLPPLSQLPTYLFTGPGHVASCWAQRVGGPVDVYVRSGVLALEAPVVLGMDRTGLLRKLRRRGNRHAAALAELLSTCTSVRMSETSTQTLAQYVKANAAPMFALPLQAEATLHRWVSEALPTQDSLSAAVERIMRSGLTVDTYALQAPYLMAKLRIPRRASPQHPTRFLLMKSLKPFKGLIALPQALPQHLDPDPTTVCPAEFITRELRVGMQHPLLQTRIRTPRGGRVGESERGGERSQATPSTSGSSASGTSGRTEPEAATDSTQQQPQRSRRQRSKGQKVILYNSLLKASVRVQPGNTGVYFD